jgi:hypothetical protein
VIAKETTMVKVGDRICWTGDLDTEANVRDGTVTRTKKDGDFWLVWVDGHNKAEDCIYSTYVWPVAAKDDLIAVLTERRRLKKAFDDSMTLIYQLKNRVSRGEFDEK